ncbi:MAG: GNAT family N-acetyltransferase [Planctomycetes bacterium]|nr:GNAT family N-acetyltransferase [Planctomycetota bacterium]
MIRRATPDDLDALVALEDASFEMYRITRARFARMLLHETRPVLVLDGVMMDGTGPRAPLVGYVSVLARRGVTEARLFSITVSAAARGRGAGRALLAAADDAARSLGCTSIRLEVAASNDAAIRLYTAAGYVPVHTWPDYYGPGQPGVVYRCRLNRDTVTAPCSTPTTRSSNG